LRETGIVGIETGMPGPPMELEDIERELEDNECRELIKQRVLEIRGVQREEYEDDDSDLNPAVSPAFPIESKSLHGQAPPYTLAELEQELQNSMKVAPAMTPKIRTKRTKEERKRTRKNSATWDMVIDKLVEESLLTRKITHQAFRQWLKRHFPDYPWNKV
jgi:sirohydrochlorin ferrochelatase